ncbi:Cell cycle serine/threonine-protein kinase cdc5/MSD2 [Linnemannia gamsii]|uniref:Cell cycle serine/threonine-protein kinase cdc5/MSD2 n=1 Tax=Linnemannia gamsii TaxID=64522 RepID=A0ABQ7JQ37_9FUNG|nr:Cell cycle serine/threonine-protein kinase cdc5/MSD2 [Linnemannia gamsii]
MDLSLSSKSNRVGRTKAKKPVDVPQKLGSMAETEQYLRTLVETRRAGRLEYSAGDNLVPTAPEVYIVERYFAQTSWGFGFRLSNGVFGVTCNDNVTVILSPNGEDIEVIHGTQVEDPYNIKPKRRRGRPYDGDDFTSLRGVKELDTFHKMDDLDHLKKLERSYCRMGDIPPQIAKHVKNITSLKKVISRSLTGNLKWTFVDEDLKKDMPFMTDIFKYDHHVTRLSNGIIQVEFPDRSTIILSQSGRIVTFMDGEENRRRVTLTTHQALSAEFFYDLNDPKDQIKTVQSELDQITQARNILHQKRGFCSEHRDSKICGDENCGAQTQETRPQFNPEKDADLCLFPRPNLEGQIRKALQGTLPSTKAMLTAGQDASQIEERPITTDDNRVVIREMTFKSLHEVIVARLRIAQRLMREPSKTRILRLLANMAMLGIGYSQQRPIQANYFINLEAPPPQKKRYQVQIEPIPPPEHI